MATIKVRKYKNSVYVIYSYGNKKLKIFTIAKVDDYGQSEVAERLKLNFLYRSSI
jgi:hypothetical protein